MTLKGVDAAVADMLIGIDTLWGGDVMNPSGTGRFIADSWFSDEPLPTAYTLPSAAALRASGGAGARSPDPRAVDAYLADVDVRGAIREVLAAARSQGELDGAHYGPNRRGDGGADGGDGGGPDHLRYVQSS